MDILILFIILVPSILILFKLTKNSTRNLPPGPWKLPFIGNMHNLAGAVPHRALHRLAVKYGPLIHLQLGEVSTVVVSSPDVAREIMKTHDLKFASRPPTMAAEIMGYGCKSITSCPYGDYWRQLRKICTLELLSKKRVQSFQRIREKVFTDLAWWIASHEGFPVNLAGKLDSSAYDITTRAVFGENSGKSERFLKILKQVIDMAAGFEVAEFFPSVKFLQKISRVRKTLISLHKEADEILNNIIDNHRAAIAGEGRRQQDLLDVLLTFQDDGLDQSLTTDSIKAVILDIVGAGSETSSTTVVWAMAELIKNPGVLQQAQEEVRRVFDGKGFVDESSSLDELKYLKSVIKETLRLHPPAPLLLPRKCDEACDINGYEIPVDTKVIINAWAINRYPKYWEDPDCFKPERFMNSVVDYKGAHFEYIPFDAGRRICPGMSFGLANVDLPLAMFLYHFDWKLPRSMKHEEMEMDEAFGVTARRKGGLFLVPDVKRPLLAL